jgi:hypothetical protein
MMALLRVAYHFTLPAFSTCKNSSISFYRALKGKVVFLTGFSESKEEKGELTVGIQ